MNGNKEINFLQNALSAVLGQKKINVSIESSGGSRVYLGPSDSVGAIAPFLLIGGDAVFSVMGGRFAALTGLVNFEHGNGGLHCLSFDDEKDTDIAKRYSILSTFSVVLDAFSKLHGIKSIDNDGMEMVDFPAEVFYQNKDMIADQVLDLISSGGMDEFIKQNAVHQDDLDDFSKFTSQRL